MDGAQKTYGDSGMSAPENAQRAWKRATKAQMAEPISENLRKILLLAILQNIQFG